MGDISFHFSNRDFVCRCGECEQRVRISLVLVGYLELIRNHFNKRVDIIKGYECRMSSEKRGSFKKNWHAFGKAIIFKVQDVPAVEVFRYAETFVEIRGVGLDPKNDAVSIDVRDREQSRFVIEHDMQVALTPVLRQQYHLGEPLPMQDLKEVKPFGSMLDDDASASSAAKAADSSAA
jgi:hypothetical protein